MAPAAFTLIDLHEALDACADLPPGLVLDDPEITLSDLAIDSAGWLSLQLELHDRYGVRIEERDVEGVRSLGELVAVVNSHLRRAGR
ncbi:MAG TPA: acyl carrier protein [Chloroflexota bacterium]|nr:acyl carrier protein [Chloroflexota bacterium]